MADWHWYVCSIDRAGISAQDERGRPDPNVDLVLTDTATPPAFRQEMFTPDASIQDQVLAVALTAISTGRRVRGLFELAEGRAEAGPCLALEIVVNLP
jgi:hypothetical protein